MSSVLETKQKMILVKESEASLTDLQAPDSTSKVAIWDLLLYIIAVCFQDLQTYFDAHRAEINTQLINEKYGTLPWYRQKALDFQDGFDLLPDSDLFDNGDASEEEIAASKVIKFAAVTEGDTNGTVVVKIATEEDETLKPIVDPAIETAIEDYFEEIKIAGTRILVINTNPDQLNLSMRVQLDPLIFTEDGLHKRNGNRPVELKILEFLKALPFDGELILQDLEISLREIEGVEIAEIIRAESSWIDPSINAYGTPTEIETKRIPESGYFEIVNFDNINYVV